MDVIRDNVEFSLEQVEALLAEDLDYEERARALHFKSQYHRAHAISSLLLLGDDGPFFEGLRRSGRSRVAVLEHWQADGRPPGRFQCASHVDPLLDAFVAGADELVSQIVELAPHEPVENEEYESHFLKAMVLHDLLQRPTTEAESLAHRLSLWSECEGADAVFVDAWTSLMNGDPDQLAESMRSLVVHWEEVYGSGPVTSNPEKDATDRYVSIEGHAIAKVAGLRGLPLPDRLSFVPWDVLR